MRRKDKEITSRSEIDDIIRGCQVCHLGLASGAEPYVIPISFGYDGQSVYFHTAREGKKLEIIAANPRVCVQFERNIRLVPKKDDACSWTFSFESVIGTGTAEELIEEESKARGLNQIMSHYSGREWALDSEVLSTTRVWRVLIETLTGKRSVPLHSPDRRS